MSYLSIKNLQKSYGKVRAVAGVDLELIRREQYVILGASGSGKSTLLYLLGGLEKADSGNIFLDGQDLTSYSDEELALYRNRQIGFVFQFHFLLPSMNCMENILLPSKISGRVNSETKQKVVGLAQELGVEHCLEKFPFELSGGEQQRVNIIRALSLEPELLLCDEPTGNLDSENSQRVVALLKKLADSYGSTLIIVTHDLGIAAQFENRIVMRDGVVDEIQHGRIDDPKQQVREQLQVKRVTTPPKAAPKNVEEVAKAPIEQVRQAEKEPESNDADSEERPSGSYVGIDADESKKTEELLKETQDLLNETEKLLSDDK